MKAIVIHENKDIRYEDFEEPKLTAGSVKINVKACGICRSDVPRALNGKAHYYPIVLGHEFSGVITEVANDVKRLKVGDHVAVAPLKPCFNCEDCNNGNYSLCKHYTFIGSSLQGGMAEYIVVPAENTVRIDKNIPFVQGALFEPATVSLHALKIINFLNANSIAIIGTGTIALFAIEWARILGAKEITVFGRDVEKMNLAKKLGATSIVNLKDDYEALAKELTNNIGYEYVIDGVGIESTIKASLEIAANKSKICLIGTPTNEVTFDQKTWENINRKELFLTGSWMSYSKPFPGEEWITTARCFADGSLKYEEDMLYKIYDMKDGKEAFMEFDKDGKVKGRIIIKNNN